MDKNRKTGVEKSPQLPAKAQPRKPAKSLVVAQRGVETGHDFAELMSGLMSDLIEGTLTPAVGNAVCNAGGKLLKVVELQHKYGAREGRSNKPVLILTN